LISLLLALVVLYSWAKHGLNTEYVVIVLVVLFVYLVTPRLAAEFRLRRIRNEMNTLDRPTEYEIKYRTIKATSLLSRVQFFEEDHQIASWNGDLNLEGETFRVIDNDGNSSLVSEGQVIATCKNSDRHRYRRSIACADLGLTLVSLNVGVFPFAVYQGDRGIGYVRSNLIVLPRSIPPEVQIFGYMIALKLYNTAMSRRDSRVGL
jgi:hypothetical protein